MKNFLILLSSVFSLSNYNSFPLIKQGLSFLEWYNKLITENKQITPERLRPYFKLILKKTRIGIDNSKYLCKMELCIPD
ncbi:MAG: hypothetical protein M1326_04565 [Cyanobacteria bacterium]|nr:hypothetical protein [Cyanobacteriota bacterium]